MAEYLLWAPSKSYHWNYPVFWGKNNCGYYSTLEDCQTYSYEEALSHANEDTVPVKLSDLESFKKTVISGSNFYNVLMEAAKTNPRKDLRG